MSHPERIVMNYCRTAHLPLLGEGKPLRDAQRASALTTVEELQAYRVQMDPPIQ